MEPRIYQGESSQHSNMSDALHSYFEHLALEANTDRENLTVVVDNAHIPLIEETLDDPLQAFSQSMSAINTVSFPPPFLSETSRWESMEGSSNSDFGLSLPTRSRDNLDSPRNNLGPRSSLDSTERWLRELPTDASLSTSRRRQACPLSPKRKSDDDLPSLKECLYEEVDTHPIVALRQSDQSKLSLEAPVDDCFDGDAEDDLLEEEELENSAQDEDVSVHISPQNELPFVGEEQEVSSPEVQPKVSSSRWPSSSGIKCASHEKDWPIRNLQSTVSPRTLVGFPYCSAPHSPVRRPPKDSTLAVVLEHETVDRIVESAGILLDYCK